jgi:hypothetical protein
MGHFDMLAGFWKAAAFCRVGTLSFSHQASLPAVPSDPDEERSISEQVKLTKGGACGTIAHLRTAPSLPCVQRSISRRAGNGFTLPRGLRGGEQKNFVLPQL